MDVRPRVADFRCRILDNGLFILNLSGSCGLVMTRVVQAILHFLKGIC